MKQIGLLPTFAYRGDPISSIKPSDFGKEEEYSQSGSGQGHCKDTTPQVQPLLWALLL